MYILNNNTNTIKCEECTKKDVCKFKGEFEFTINKVTEMSKDYDLCSPIKISVSCTAAMKDARPREIFAREYDCKWIGDMTTGNVDEMKTQK